MTEISMDLVDQLQSSLLAHGCEAVYGAVDWHAVADDLLTFLDANPRSRDGMCGNIPNTEQRTASCLGGARQLICQLRFGHQGWHECLNWEGAFPAKDVIVPSTAHWGATWTETTDGGAA